MKYMNVDIYYIFCVQMATIWLYQQGEYHLEVGGM